MRGVDPAVQRVGRFVPEQAGRRQRRQRRRKLAGVSPQHRDDAMPAVALAAARDAREDLAHELTLVGVDAPGTAVAARAARLADGGVAEVAEDRRAQALRRVGVVDHALAASCARAPSGAPLPRDRAPRRSAVRACRAADCRSGTRRVRDVGVVPQQRRRRRTSVASGASNLLVVRLDRSRESRSGRPRRRPDGRCPSRTRWSRRRPAASRRRTRPARACARRPPARRDTRPPGHPRPAASPPPPRRLAASPHTRARGARGRAPAARSFLSSSPSTRSTRRWMFGRSNPATSTCGSSRPSSATMSSRTSGVAVAVNAAIGGRPDRASLGRHERRGRAQPPVVGPEVVAPLRDAVRLVDDEARDVELAEQPQELIGCEPFGRDVQQPQRVPPRGAQHARAGCRPSSIECSAPDADAASIQLVDLILHQRDQRRHDERRPGQHHRRQLVAERLARSGRHHREHVAPAEHGGDDLLLSLPELRMTEVRRADASAHRSSRSSETLMDDDDGIVPREVQYGSFCNMRSVAGTLSVQRRSRAHG